MADLTIQKKIYLDGNKPGGPDASLDGETSSPPSTPYAFMAGDTYPVIVYFRARAADNGASTALTPVAGSTCVIAGKLATPDTLLFSAELAILGECYAGTLDTNTAEVIAALTSVNRGGSVPVFIDCEVKDAAGTKVLSYRANCNLYQQVYAGETSPSSVVPPTPIILSPDGSRWQIAASNDGELKLTKV